MTNVTEQLEQARLESRSWLYRWLYVRHEELAPVLNGPRPPFSALAATIKADAGWTDDKPPSRQSVRETWLRIKREKTSPLIAHKPRAKPGVPATEPPAAAADPQPRLLILPQPGRPAPSTLPAKEPTDDARRNTGRPSSFSFDPTPKENERDLWKGPPKGKDE